MEQSFLTLGTRAEDNFEQLEKISYPILNRETVSIPHHLSEKMVYYPIQKFSFLKHRSMERSQAVPGSFHTVQVNYHFQVPVTFSFNL